MLRGILRIALVVGTVAWAFDALLRRRDRGTVPPVRMAITIDAPRERTWRILSDIPRQPAWMTDMKRVEMTTPEPVGVGSRGRALVRMFGIPVDDPVEVTVFEPPSRFAVRHDGIFTGGGVMDLEPGADPSTTVVTWDETLVAPVFPHLTAAIGAPVFRRVFQDDLGRLKRLVETDA